MERPPASGRGRGGSERLGEEGRQAKECRGKLGAGYGYDGSSSGSGSLGGLGIETLAANKGDCDYDEFANNVSVTKPGQSVENHARPLGDGGIRIYPEVSMLSD